MKFVLIIWMCSFLGNSPTCLPPIEFNILYNSWYECSRGALQESTKILSKLGYKYVNKNQIGMSYSCKKVPII